MEDNIETVINVLKRLANEGLKIAPQKLKLAQTSVEILGIQVKNSKLSIPESRVQAYLEYKTV